MLLTMMFVFLRCLSTYSSTTSAFQFVHGGQSSTASRPVFPPLLFSMLQQLFLLSWTIACSIFHSPGLITLVTHTLNSSATAFDTDVKHTFRIPSCPSFTARSTFSAFFYYRLLDLLHPDSHDLKLFPIETLLTRLQLSQLRNKIPAWPAQPHQAVCLDGPIRLLTYTDTLCMVPMKTELTFSTSLGIFQHHSVAGIVVGNSVTNTNACLHLLAWSRLFISPCRLWRSAPHRTTAFPHWHYWLPLFFVSQKALLVLIFSTSIPQWFTVVYNANTPLFKAKQTAQNHQTTRCHGNSLFIRFESTHFAKVLIRFDSWLKWLPKTLILFQLTTQAAS